MVNKECQTYKYAINKYGVSKKTEPMACTTDFIDFVCSQIKDAGTVRARKMFGDWMIYVDEKPVIIACDNVCFIKMLPAVHDLMADALTAHPYDGAKLHYILDIEHRDKAVEVVRALRPAISCPKKREKKPKH